MDHMKTTQQSILNIEDWNDSPQENKPMASNVAYLNNSRQENQPSASNMEDLNNSREKTFFQPRSEQLKDLNFKQIKFIFR